MPDCKLTYFDFPGGRGEPIRIAFHAAGIDFDDHRISFDEFLQTRSLRAGTLDHVPTDLVDRLAPNLVAQKERIAVDPVVTGYYVSLKHS